jgi:hypothetical protein
VLAPLDELSLPEELPPTEPPAPEDEEEAPLEELPPLLSERMAKSTRPEVGLMMASLIVPTCWPDWPVTVAPCNWLAWICCCMRPVAPSWLCPPRPRLLEELEVPSEESLELEEPVEPEEPLEEDPPEEVCACAWRTSNAAQNAIIVNSCFLIPAFS